MRTSQKNTEQQKSGRRWFFWVGFAILVIVSFFWILLIPFIVNKPNIAGIIFFILLSAIPIALGMCLLMRGRHSRLLKKRALLKHIETEVITSKEELPKNPRRKSFRVGMVLLILFSFSMMILLPFITGASAIKTGIIILLIPIAVLMSPGMYFLIYGTRSPKSNDVETLSKDNTMISGVFDLVSGACLLIAALLSTIAYSEGDIPVLYPILAPLIMLGLLAIAGGVSILQKQLWSLAFIGSLCAIAGYGLGIPAVILIVFSRNQFVKKALKLKNNSAKKEEELKSNVICKRVRICEGRPRPGSLKSFLTIGGSDSGCVEYNGSTIRFIGKKIQIDIPEITNISEVKPNLKLIHFLLYFVSFAVILWLLPPLPFLAKTIDIIDIMVSITVALLGTVFSWWYLRKYGRWVWISYTSSDGQSKDIGFWGAPISGGSQRLYKDLLKLVTLKLFESN